ncbi:MAG: transcriptional regulator, LuxR family, partial [Rubrobacteraceae bacterium]|nr:transcriptional regulator, LuxR family [Rubrobacteraceae bacterium]
MADSTEIGARFSAGSAGSARPREDGPGSLVVLPRTRGPQRPSHNLPLELTSFVGRERALAEVKRLLQSARLLTLTGPGGCGKTRLALKVAQDVVERFENGAWLVELAPLSDPALVPQAVAQALGVRDQPGRPLTETLADSLGSEQLLLVLDNCEHLIEATARFVETMLTRCPDLHILATSREPLNVGGEANWSVPSLSVPEEGRLLPAEDPARYEAVRLFVERAEAILPDFALTDRNAPQVTRVCRRLGGIPLAIELAAARVKVLSVEQIAGRLDDCFGLLTAGSRTALPRQRTLRATIDWSHALLGQEEQTLFRRLSVFAGGSTLEVAEAVCAGEGLEGDEVLDVLSRLVEKSLVVMRDRDGEARYHLLEMVRQYGWSKLEESGEAETVRRRHAIFFLALAEEAELTGAEQGVWLDLLEAELDNLRAAIGWSIEGGEPEMWLRFAGALSYFCYLRGYYGEGREWFEGALPGDGAAPAPLRAKALLGVGLLAFLQCEYERATALLRESAALYRELADKRGLASTLQLLGSVEREQGRYEQARAFHQESLDLSRESGDEAGVANALAHRGIVAWMEGDYERAAQLCTQALPMCRGLGETHATVWSLIVLGTGAHHHGDHERGTKLLEESLALSLEGYAEGVPFSLNQLGIAAYRRGEHEQAAALLKVSLVLHRDLGNGWRVASVLEGLAEVASVHGNHERATRLFGA